MTDFTFANEDVSANQAESWTRRVIRPSASLSRQEALILLNKLGHDDKFRRLFEGAPAEALGEIGVSMSKIASFPAASLQPVKLAPKEKFECLHTQITQQPTTEWLCMIIPQFRIDQ
ncbi:MAG TPA: NHLP-related RiPP peptide [Rhodanobacteraceae bacterium]|nr:NHLP-related RiPP peptide [Rhodanobacteraceae bacterium]